MAKSGRGHRLLTIAVMGLSVLASAVLGAMLSSQASGEAATPAQGEAAGAGVFANSCASCHQANGQGIPGSFPPLRGNPNATDAAYVETVVRDGLSGPIDVDGEAYDAQMPPISLSDDEVSAVATYVVEIAGDEGSGPAEPTDPDEPVEGTVAAGKSAFTGSARFENGAAACVSCHVAGEVGNFGGSGLGPDLTHTAEGLGGEAGLAAWLVNPPSATMAPIFSERPLTPQETADLSAFLADAPDQNKASTAPDGLLIGAIIGTAALLAGMAVAWRGMRQTYQDRLRSKQ